MVDVIVQSMQASTHIAGTLVEKVDGDGELQLTICSCEVGSSAIGALRYCVGSGMVMTATDINLPDFIRAEFSSVPECASEWRIHYAPAYVFLRNGDMIAALSGAHPAELEATLESLNNDPNVEIEGDSLADLSVDLSQSLSNANTANEPDYLTTEDLLGPENPHNRENVKEYVLGELKKQVEELIPALSNLAGWWTARKILERWFP